MPFGRDFSQRGISQNLVGLGYVRYYVFPDSLQQILTIFLVGVESRYNKMTSRQLKSSSLALDARRRRKKEGRKEKGKRDFSLLTQRRRVLFLNVASWA